MRIHCVFMSFLLRLFCLATYTNAGGRIPGVELLMPPSHVALSGDLHVQIKSSSFPPLLLQLSRLEGNVAQALTTIQILPRAEDLANKVTNIRISCGFFSRGGQYYVLLKKQDIGSTNTTLSQEDDSTIIRSLDVRWPMPRLSLTPENVQTYPESPVLAILEFPEVVCPPMADSPATAIPEFWLELHYCGHSLLTCDSDVVGTNQTNVQVLYSEQVRGFPGRRIVTLRCELFGLAGRYALFLRPTAPTPPLPQAAAYVKADWSEQFVFNVHARSIIPCDTHGGGVTVLFQYPSCILPSSDRVRLFARLRANVASLASPTSLEYVAEQPVRRGQHSLHFDCDLFSERYVEYCFVYVSQAITKAVADVRMDCVPTLPVTESESGGWGPWSPWTPCSTTCIGGTRSRYRFCDSPPPRYGAKFCEGKAVETESCGGTVGGSLECFYGNLGNIGDIAAVMPQVEAEIGPYCRCGCIVHLGQAKPKRLLATSSQSCPGRTFWLIQADPEYIIQFRVDRFHLPCGTQRLKVRDGKSLASNLLADFTGEPDLIPAYVNSTGPNLLLDFFSEEMGIAASSCNGGFLAHANQIKSTKMNITEMPIAQSVGLLPAVVFRLTAVHIAAFFFLSGILIATILLGIQYLFRYRKYHIAQADDQDSLADPTISSSSLALRNRAVSNVTLLSEVISMTKLRPHINTRNKHSRLRESINVEVDHEEQTVTLAKEEESLSVSSTLTLTQQEETLTTALQQSGSEKEETTGSLPNLPQTVETRTICRSSTLTSEKDNDTEKDELKSTSSTKNTRRLSNVSTATLTHVRASSETCSKSDPGFYSPAANNVSTAKIRSTTAKEAKEKRNREKLLAGPIGSEISIVGPDSLSDLEMDYYDYNVRNAGAAPGSYLGMDPAFLVWIPPLDESGEVLPEPPVFVDPGSNQESPDDEDLRKELKPFIEDCVALRDNNKSKTVSIQLSDISRCRLNDPSGMEKETEVEKSPSIDSILLDEIKFADDDDDDSIKELCGNVCNMKLSYQDSNILSSN